MISDQWDIKPRSRLCQNCRATFVDKQPYFTRLSHTQAGYERLDCCERCWEEQVKGGAAGARHSTWRGVFKVAPAEPKKTVKKETAESLLRGLLEKGDLSRRNTVYILAVMLERQRLLVEKEVTVREDGSRALVYEHRKTGEVFVIPDPQLKLRQLEHVQKEVMELLTGKPADAPAPEAAAEPKTPGAP